MPLIPSLPPVFYIDVLKSLDKVYRNFLRNLKSHLTVNGYKNINPTQALIVYYVGPRTIKATEVVSQEFYNGSNASYNIRQMIDHRYLISFPCENDGRVIFLSLAPKGLEIYSFMVSLFTKHQDQLAVSGIHKECWDQMLKYATQMVRFWRKDEPYLRP